MLCALLALCVGSWAIADDEPRLLRIGLFHMKPELGNMTLNTRRVQQAMRVARCENVDWMSTPELALTGYRFTEVIGTEWMTSGPDEYVQSLQAEARSLGLVLFLGHLEQIEAAGNGTESVRHNTLFVIDGSGEIVARHRKINTIPVAEDWSTPGKDVTVAALEGINVGLMICADAWPQEHALALRDAGADLMLNSATWPPGKYGPGQTWAKRSRETGLPIFVNNRTGKDLTLDSRAAQSVLFHQGQQWFSHTSDDPALIILDWNVRDQVLVRQRVILLNQS